MTTNCDLLTRSPSDTPRSGRRGRACCSAVRRASLHNSSQFVFFLFPVEHEIVANIAMRTTRCFRGSRSASKNKWNEIRVMFIMKYPRERNKGEKTQKSLSHSSVKQKPLFWLLYGFTHTQFICRFCTAQSPSLSSSSDCHVRNRRLSPRWMG